MSPLRRKGGVSHLKRRSCEDMQQHTRSHWEQTWGQGCGCMKNFVTYFTLTACARTESTEFVVLFLKSIVGLKAICSSHEFRPQSCPPFMYMLLGDATPPPKTSKRGHYRFYGPLCVAMRSEIDGQKLAKVCCLVGVKNVLCRSKTVFVVVRSLWRRRYVLRAIW